MYIGKPGGRSFVHKSPMYSKVAVTNLSVCSVSGTLKAAGFVPSVSSVLREVV